MRTGAGLAGTGPSLRSRSSGVPARPEKTVSAPDALSRDPPGSGLRVRPPPSGGELRGDSRACVLASRHARGSRDPLPEVLPRARGGVALGLAFVLSLAGLCVVPPRAAELPDLYEAEVPVSTQEAVDREGALGLALRRVLTKVSGRRGAGSHEALAGALQAPEPFVQEYQYRIRPAGEPDSGEGDALRLWAKFDAHLVDALIRETGLPVWGRTRPSTLVWLSVERSGGRELLAADEAASYLASIEEGAGRRGIPLVLPLLDLEDRLAVNADELWAGFLGRLRDASARYESDAVLLVRLRERPPDLAEVHWSLLTDGGEQHWSTQADLPELLLEDGVHTAADLLAARYSGPADGYAAGSVDLVVSGVLTLEDYARALGYLSDLDEVERLDVEAVETGQVRFRLVARGGPARVRQTLMLGATLVPDGPPAPDGALQVRLEH